MDYSREISKKLAEIEVSFRDLGANAFRDGDDSAVEHTREIVQAIKRFREVLTEQASGKNQNGDLTIPRVPRTKSTPESRRSRSKVSEKYPRYEVRNDVLVRVGWSKKKKTEYKHKAFRSAYDQVVEAIENLSTHASGPYMAENIIEMASDMGYQVPNYQVYIIIGVLRDKGCLDQVGKGEYQVISDFSGHAAELWASLAKGDS